MTQKIVRRELPATPLQAPDLHPLLQRIYSQRGIASSDELEHSLQGLLPYHELSNIDQAVALLVEAIQQQQHILILGDFDVDGATSTTLAVTALREFGAAQVSFLVPNRFAYGYGLTPEIVDVAAKQHPDMIVTVDNGVSSIEGVARAKELGIDVIITDHHLAGQHLPDAAAIVNPNLPGDIFKSKHLAGVGVIFYVMLALRAKLRNVHWFIQQGITEPNMANYLDLVAIGTVADVVPLDRNNRILVHQGLRRIRANKSRAGVQALLNIAGRDARKVSASDIGFALAPRLNAAGRLDDMSLGIDCLLTADSMEAQRMAMELDALNKQRRVIEKDMQEQAFAILNDLHFDNEVPMGICLYDPCWHQGVVGILASRVKDRMQRPVIAFAKGDDGKIKGSARSIAGLHIRDVLEDIATNEVALIEKFGGHAMAAGLTIAADRFEYFRQCFANAIAKRLSKEDLCGTILSDGALQATEVTLQVAELIREAGPWGQNFPEPLFDNTFRILDQRIVGTNHLKLTLAMEDGAQIVDAIAFNIDTAIWPNYRCEQVHAAFRLDVNEFRGRSNVQLIVEHIEAI